MRAPRSQFIPFLFLMLARPASGQEAVPPSRAMALLDAVVPFHAQPGDAAGLWTAGPGYKARLEDGFTFYPFLGQDAPRPHWVRWRTTSIRAGAHELLEPLAQATLAAAGTRAELARGAVTERYDALRGGLEQSFVLARAPAFAGDLMITGRITTTLTAPPSGLAHGPVRFHDQHGAPVVEYGAAFVLDSAGRKAAIQSRLVGDELSLTVPQDWLADAIWPVTVDPLTQTNVVSSMSNLGIAELDIGHDGRSATLGTLVVLERAVSAQDHDLYGFLTDDHFSGPALVFLTLLPSLSEKPRVAFVGGADRWVLVYQEEALQGTATRNHVKVYAHDRQSAVFNGGGVPATLPAGTGVTQRRPDVGGTAPFSSGANALIVWQTDTTITNQNTPSTEVQGALFDAQQRTFAAPFLLANAPVGTQLDRENPTVNQTSAGGSAPWCVAWQGRDRTVAAARIAGNLVRPDGTRAGEAHLNQGAAGPAFAIQPQVAGSDGRYLVAYLGALAWDAAAATRLDLARFDWPDQAATPQPVLMAAHADVGAQLGSVAEPRLTFDSGTGSHWALSYLRTALVGRTRLAVSRLGSTGGTVEYQTAYDNPNLDATHSALAWSATSQSFQLLGSDHGGGALAYAWRLLYPPDAVATAYGSGCGGTISSVAPHAGHGAFEVRLATSPASVAAVLLLSSGQGAYSLAGAGMTGCSLNLDPGFLLALPAVVANQHAAVQLPLPDRPAFFGDLYFQWLEVRPGANPAQVVSTRGLRAQVR